jgi:hypothetical protein
MSRDQIPKSEIKSIQQAFVNECKLNPISLPEKVVKRLLNELCIGFGCCLKPVDCEKILENPPTDPDTFARLVMEMEYGGSGDTEIFNSIFGYIYNTFLGVYKKNT